MDGKGLCFTCHTVGKKGALRFPDLEASDARRRRASAGSPTSSTSRRAMYDPTSSSSPGFNPGMPSSTSRRSG
jgi:hypothetical protein